MKRGAWDVVGRALCLGLAFLAMATTEAAAQDRGIEVGILRTGTVAAGGPLSYVRTARFHSVELEVGIPLATGEKWALHGLVGVLPYAWVNETALGPAAVAASRDGWVVPEADGRATSRGVGVRPVGLRLIRGHGAVNFQAHLSGGIVRFTLPTPAANATAANFTGELGLGFRARTGWGHLGVGYRFHHLSNAGRGEINPGVDSHQFYIGVWAH